MTTETDSAQSRIKMCKLIMRYKINTFDKELSLKLYTHEDFRIIYGATAFSVETNVAAATELCQSGDLDLFYEANCPHCDTINSFMEIDPMNGETLKSLANGLAKCKYCDHSIQVDLTKKDPFKVFYRVSKKYNAHNSQTHLIIADEPQVEITKSAFSRLIDKLRGRS